MRNMLYYLYTRNYRSETNTKNTFSSHKYIYNSQTRFVIIVTSLVNFDVNSFSLQNLIL